MKKLIILCMLVVYSNCWAAPKYVGSYTGLQMDTALGTAQDSDIVALAALSTTAYGRALLTAASEAGLLAYINLEIGVDVEAFDAAIAKTDEAETITANWINTASPWADNEVADDITIDLATLASTVTIADNESTNESNALVFLPGGDLDGGDLALESDGTLNYNPSTGTLTTTQFSGGGAAVTDVDASTGDSATAFFDAGTIEDVRIASTIARDSEVSALQADDLVTLSGVVIGSEHLSTFSGTTIDDDQTIKAALQAIETAVEASGAGTVDTSGTPVANDFARFTDVDTVAGLSYSETRTALDLEAGTDFYDIASADTAFEGELDNEAGLYAALSDVSRFYEAGDVLQGDSGTDLPATCTVGEMFLDTNADTDGSLYICISTNTWKNVDDDGAVGGGDFLADGSVPMTADINTNGSNIDNLGVLFLLEQAEADADLAGSGQIWVDTQLPNILMFTDDAGTDFELVDDVPDAGDFGNATDLDANGALSADVIAAAEMADADHGDVAWSSGVATVQAVSGANAVNSSAYVDASIDEEHISPDVISGQPEVTSVDADYLLVWDATDSDLKKVDAAEFRGGISEYNDIGDPDASGSISMGAYTGTYTSGTEAWGGMIIESSDADNAGDTTLLSLKHYDDFDTNSIFLACINDSDSGADNIAKITGLGMYVGAGTPDQTMTGDDVYITGFLEVDGPIYADGGIVSASATPKTTLDDTGGADGYIDANAASADDAVMTIGVDDSNGDDQSYIEIDGVNERIETKYPMLSEGNISILEQADADTDIAGYGQVWVNTASPNELWFTDDDGTDFQLGVAGAGDISNVGLCASGACTGDFIDGTDVVDEAINSEHYVDGSIDPDHLSASAFAITTASKSADYTIGETDAQECYGGVIYVTSTCDITACDNLAAGMAFTVITIGATQVELDVQSDDSMILDGVQLDDGDKATNTSTAGDSIVCIYYGAAGLYCMSGSPDGDNWTDGGS